MLLNYEITVEGRVQGVGYRYFVRSKAQELHLAGYVRNSGGGRVIIMAEGEKDELDTLVDYLWIGPPLARVRNVEISKAPYTGSYLNFSIKV